MSKQATNVVWDCPHCTSLNRTPKSQDVVCGVCGEYSLYSDVLHSTDDVTGYFNEVESRFSAKHKKTAYELLPEKEQLVTSLFVAQFNNAVPINEAVENIYKGIEAELQMIHSATQIRGKIRDYIESKTDEHAIDSGIDYQVGDLLKVIDTLLTKLTAPQLLELTKDEDFLESCINFDRDELTEAIKCDA